MAVVVVVVLLLLLVVARAFKRNDLFCAAMMLFRPIDYMYTYIYIFILEVVVRVGSGGGNRCKCMFFIQPRIAHFSSYSHVKSQHTMINRQMNVSTLTAFVLFFSQLSLQIEWIHSLCMVSKAAVCAPPLALSSIHSFILILPFYSIPFCSFFLSSYSVAFFAVLPFAIVNVRQNQTAWDCTNVHVLAHTYTHTHKQPWPCISTKIYPHESFVYSHTHIIIRVYTWQHGQREKKKSNTLAVFPQWVSCTLSKPMT